MTPDEVLCYVGEWTHRPRNVAVVPWVDPIHPRNFREAAANLMVSIWTNNPLMVDCFPADRVIVCYAADCRFYTKKLSEHQNYQKWKDEFASGEFWSMVGESWVLAGTPAKGS